MEGGERDGAEPATDGAPPPWAGARSNGNSEWSINWPAVVPVLALVIIVVLLWRAIEDDDGQATPVDGDIVETVASTAPPSTVATTTTTLRRTTTVFATTTVVSAPQVSIRAEMKPCRFGANCLVASFTVEGFEQTSGQFTCIYPNSERDFSFQDDGKDDACITADEGDTITIVVDGVRSATVSEENLTGAP